jgi:hypothetical protein
MAVSFTHVAVHVYLPTLLERPYRMATKGCVLPQKRTDLQL